jgi:hypothetical protein
MHPYPCERIGPHTQANALIVEGLECAYQRKLLKIKGEAHLKAGAEAPLAPRYIGVWVGSCDENGKSRS